MRWRRLPPLFGAALLGACATPPVERMVPAAADDAGVARCIELVDDVEHAVRAAGVVDRQARRVDGFPYLRLTRFLASYRDTVDGVDADAAFDTWVDRMQALALEGWSFETANLPPAERARLLRGADTTAENGGTLGGALRDCSDRLRREQLGDADARRHLVEHARVPDDYATWKRVLGLYEISAGFFLEGIAAWHERARAVFATPRHRLAVDGTLTTYAPNATTRLSRDEIAATLVPAAADPLQIPQPGAAALARLFDHFAPMFEVDTVTDADRIGRIALDDRGFPRVDVARPVVYRYPTHTRVGDRVLLQLNYVAWFPARPKTSALDLLGGHLDGIVWRVTLLPDGRPWLFDSIHPCGCYHMVFPTPRAVSLPREPAPEEPVLVGPQVAATATDRARIRLSSHSHYIEQVDVVDEVPAGAVAYALDDHDRLRSLPIDGNRRTSLYGEDGIVAGTERGERFLFWPMGIASPGAMRQPGTRATAFVGRRHFDDARLFEPLFAIAPPRQVATRLTTAPRPASRARSARHSDVECRLRGTARTVPGRCARPRPCAA